MNRLRIHLLHGRELLSFMGWLFRKLVLSSRRGRIAVLLLGLFVATLGTTFSYVDGGPVGMVALAGSLVVCGVCVQLVERWTR